MIGKLSIRPVIEYQLNVILRSTTVQLVWNPHFLIYRMGHEKVARVKANTMRSRTASGGGVGDADSTTVA
jgi:hypothetical protein